MAAFLLVACSTIPPDVGAAESPAAANGATATAPAKMTCTSPRTKHCPDSKQPVCATRDTGIRCVTTPCDSSEDRTYDNACMACLDPKVESFVMGVCPEAKPTR